MSHENFCNGPTWHSFYSNTGYNHPFSGILTKLIFGENIVKKVMTCARLAQSPAGVDTGLTRENKAMLPLDIIR